MQHFKVRGSDTNSFLIPHNTNQVELRLDNIGRPCMKDTFMLFEWILEACRLKRAITYHLPTRNAGRVHLDSNNPGACQPDHVYFGPPRSPLCMKTLEHCTPAKAHLSSLCFSRETHCVKITGVRGTGVNGPARLWLFFFAEIRMVRSRAKSMKGAETCPRFLSGHSALLSGGPPAVQSLSQA